MTTRPPIPSQKLGPRRETAAGAEGGTAVNPGHVNRSTYVPPSVPSSVLPPKRHSQPKVKLGEPQTYSHPNPRILPNHNNHPRPPQPRYIPAANAAPQINHTQHGNLPHWHLSNNERAAPLRQASAFGAPRPSTSNYNSTHPS